MDYKTLFDAIMLGESDSIALASDIDSFVNMIKQALAEIEADGYAEACTDSTAEHIDGLYMTPSGDVCVDGGTALLLCHNIEKRDAPGETYTVPRII